MEEEEVDAMALWLHRWHQTIHCKTDTPNVVLVGQCQLLLGARQGVVVAGDEGVVEVCDGDVSELEGCDAFVASSLGTDASVRGSHCSCNAAAAVAIALAHAFLCADRTHWGATWTGTHFPSRALPASPMAADDLDDVPRRARALEMSDDEPHFCDTKCCMRTYNIPS